MSPTLTYSATGAIALLLVAMHAAPAPAEAPEPFASGIAAYRAGVEAQRAGRHGAALDALEFAADRGVLGAQLKLARMHASGDGAPRSDAKAFRYYQRIADHYADASLYDPVARYAAEAFVAVGRYHEVGIAELGLPANPARAADLYRHAASYFGDPEAQYRLARLYLEGSGVPKNVTLAVNWLTNAAKKQHAASQALLGEILWRGREDVRRQPFKGLALLTLARDNAVGRDEAGWIEPLFRRALAEAAPEERDGARTLLVLWKHRLSAEAEASLSDPQAEPGKGAASAPRRPSSAPAQPTAPLVPSVAVGPLPPITPSAGKPVPAPTAKTGSANQ